MCRDGRRRSMVRPIAASQLSELLKTLQPPSKSKGLRVLALEVGDTAKYGVGHLQENPILVSTQVHWPLRPCEADELISCGVPLSLASVLQYDPRPDMQTTALALLHALVGSSEIACDQLNNYRKLPLLCASAPSNETVALVAEVESRCKQRLEKVGHSAGGTDWTRFAASYELWFCHGGARVAKVHVRGVGKTEGAFDFGGVHLTGGRVWAGSVILARWLISMKQGCSQQLGAGRILEIGAGVGLAGISIAKLGYEVVLSDREPTLLDRIRENIEANSVQNQCRVLDLDWAAAGQPKMRRLLHAQKFSAVIGADLIYESEGQYL
eukprot:gnl/TRDRNA2_/TRDRNA2_173888_c0_seq1.p1 gnl/TRDRNA2_/TRDRNA2_173888_c0~~gnl/TRDRNA2_/TRDRNA2_173888_c0_seq1.p1  ORF type:complete len:334 (-),score=22.66 gnl/TRDRNA2_/TRDRNA2_173888_c0_seq1:5-979(-)